MQTLSISFYRQFYEKVVLYVQQRRYECLLLSFMLLIFGDTFSHPLILVVSNILQNMLVGLFIVYNRKTLRNIIVLLILASLILSVFGHQLLKIINVKSWQGIIYLVFFLLISKEVFKEVLYAKTVTRELLSAVLCGFVLLCLISTFLFYQINLKIPNSFSNTGTEKDTMKNLNYFSFTTLLTIGYGDITPLRLVAKRAVMLMGLAGHFYTVFITSIIIGKYLSAKPANT